ncbi:MAG: GntR family transcriptional regulator [Thaumarchaeota archaeon]|nr:GntR family transcriptional regulator [Nitrososphaerota archaeon]
MGIGAVISGMITTLLGVAGLMAIYGLVASPIPLAPLASFLGFGLTVILFAAIAVIGVVVIAEGIFDDSRPVIVRPAAVTTTPVVSDEPLSDLDYAILSKVSERKGAGEIAEESGVSKQTVREKIAMLKARGYLTRDRRLTELGYETVRVPPAEQVVTG